MAQQPHSAAETTATRGTLRAGTLARAARAAGKWVGVCGEAAGAPHMIPILLSYGVSELSMSPALIARAKKIVTEN